MDKISPIVITSKAADKHYETIKAQHADILLGMQNQATRVANLNLQKETEQKTIDQENKKNSMEQKKITMEAENKKLEMENKRRELEIKHQALNS